MNILFTSFLILHILGGSIGLFTGTINLIRIKGDKFHKRTGKFFTYGMLTAGFSALILSIIHPNHFLLIVGIFTIYMVGTGNRYIYLKMLGSGQRPSVIDRILTISMLATGLLFIVLGIRDVITGDNFGIVFIVFGAIGLRMVKIDLDNYNGKVMAKNYWLLMHLQRMTGGYIAAATAFLVVNAKYIHVNFPSIVFWLLPTVILTPLIFSWTKKYKSK